MTVSGYTKAALDAKLAQRIPVPASPPTDGQLLAYSATLGAYTPVNPVGQAELAAAVNLSGVAVPLNVQDYGATVYTALPGMSMVVPPSNGRPVTITWDGLFAQPTAGSGNMWIQCTGPAGSILSIHHLPIDTGDTATAADYYDMFHGIARVGVITVPTTFTLSAMVYRLSSAATPAVNIMPLATAPLVMRAVAG